MYTHTHKVTSKPSFEWNHERHHRGHYGVVEVVTKTSSETKISYVVVGIFSKQIQGYQNSFSDSWIWKKRGRNNLQKKVAITSFIGLLLCFLPAAALLLALGYMDKML